MKLKYLIFLFTLLSQSTIILCQNYFVSNIYNNTAFTNPAYVLFNDFSIAQLNYRNQWPISNMYTSYGAAYFHNASNLNSNFGAIINYDSQYKGTISQTALGLNYAYKLRIARHSHFLFGLQGFYNFGSKNFSKLKFENQVINMPVNESLNFPSVNAGIGLLLYDEQFIGISASKQFNSSNTKSPFIFNATYIGKVKANNYYSDVYYEPIINISSNLESLLIKYGGNVNLSGIKAGLLVSQNGIKFNAFVILLGISFENYDIVYTYDLNLSGVVTLNPKMAAHEVTFLSKFEYKGRSKRKGAIKCPDI